MIGKLKEFLQKNGLANKIMTNYEFRTIVFSLFSLAAGIAYAAFNLAVGLIYRSLWYGALAFYYIMLDVIRGGVLFNRYRAARYAAEKKRVCEIRQYCLCGALLVALTVALAAMVVHIAERNKTFEYSFTVIYMMASYTFYRIAVSVHNFIRSRKRQDYTVRALRCVNLATALVSFLSLQSAALTAFSQNVDQILVNSLTGGIVCAMIVAMGVFMIVSAIRQEKRVPLGSEITKR